MKLAFVDGLTHFGDPKFMKVDIHDLLSDSYGKHQAKRITRESQIFSPHKPYSSGTVYLSTADQHGNMVSLIQSNYTGFGSGMVVPNTGIALNNRGACFSLDPHHVNVLGPKKKSYNTIIPGFLLKENKPVGPFAIMGGFMQPQGHIQLLANMIDYNQNPQLALNEPRWQWIKDKVILVEPHFPKHIIKQLEARGHQIIIDPNTAKFGRAHLIFRLDNGVLVGAKEPRTDSYIACY
jgi:gamma-glutamyltranspeptidase/glutathione hydrolase